MKKSKFLKSMLAAAFVMTAILVGPPGNGNGPNHKPSPTIPPIVIPNPSGIGNTIVIIN